MSNRQLHHPLLAALSALAVVACEAPEPTATPSVPRVEPVSAQRGKPVRPRTAAAERVVAQRVTWPARETVDVAVRSRLDATQLRKVDAADLPVLAPREPAVYALVHVASKPAWFSVSLKDAEYADELAAQREKRALPARGGVSVFVQGSRLAHAYPHIPPATGNRTLRGHQGWVTQNESIWSATWKENGVDYTVEVECSRPDDARCADDALLVEMVESLAFVGGAGDVAAAAKGGAK